MSIPVSVTPLTTSQRILRDTVQEEFAPVNMQNQSEEERKRLEEACAEFESLFICQVLTQMRKTVVKSGLVDGGKGEEIFTSLMDEELSKQISIRQGLGLSEPLIEQLTGERTKMVPQSIITHTYDRTKNDEGGDKLFVLPAMGSISSPYGWRKDPFTGERDFHCGMDIASPLGTEVYAADAGRVVFSGWKVGYGKVIEIEHQNGFSTLYAHNSNSLVKEGENVTKNQPIALVGGSGRSTGPHLHYEVRKNGEPINPTRVTRMDRGIWYAQKL